MQFSLLGRKKGWSLRSLILTHCNGNYLRNIMKALAPSFCICKSLANSCWLSQSSFQSENSMHIVIQTRFGPHSPIPVSYVSLLISFWETHIIGTKKPQISFPICLFMLTSGKCLSFIHPPPFHKHCLSAVWRIGSAEFLLEINAFVKEKGTSPAFVELSQPRRPLKSTCSLQVSCSSTDSSQTCLADEI